MLRLVADSRLVARNEPFSTSVVTALTISLRSSAVALGALASRSTTSLDLISLWSASLDLRDEATKPSLVVAPLPSITPIRAALRRFSPRCVSLGAGWRVASSHRLNVTLFSAMFHSRSKGATLPGRLNERDTAAQTGAWQSVRRSGLTALKARTMTSAVPMSSPSLRTATTASHMPRFVADPGISTIWHSCFSPNGPPSVNVAHSPLRSSPEGAGACAGAVQPADERAAEGGAGGLPFEKKDPSNWRCNGSAGGALAASGGCGVGGVVAGLRHPS